VTEQAVGQPAPVTKIRRIWDVGSENRRYLVTTADGREQDVTVFDRDQQAVDLLYRIYRRARLKTQVSRSAPLTMERAVERHALLTYAVRDAGVATPPLHALVRVGSEASVLSCDKLAGTALSNLPGLPTDEQLANVWSAVTRLHEHSVTHRNLTAEPDPAGRRRSHRRHPARPPAMATWRPATCKSASTWLSWWPSSRSWSGPTGPPTWPGASPAAAT